jgi:hypothetical protein
MIGRYLEATVRQGNDIGVGLFTFSTTGLFEEALSWQCVRNEARLTDCLPGACLTIAALSALKARRNLCIRFLTFASALWTDFVQPLRYQQTSSTDLLALSAVLHTNTGDKGVDHCQDKSGWAPLDSSLLCGHAGPAQGGDGPPGQPGRAAQGAGARQVGARSAGKAAGRAAERAGEAADQDEGQRGSTQDSRPGQESSAGRMEQEQRSDGDARAM